MRFGGSGRKAGRFYLKSIETPEPVSLPMFQYDPQAASLVPETASA